MAVDTDLQTQWEAFLKLIQVREPRLYEHLKIARPKEITKYNVVLLAQNVEDLKEMEVGLKVYHDKIIEFTPLVFGESRGLKTELASEEDWQQTHTASHTPSAGEEVKVSADQHELLKVLETSIRKKVEAEMRAALQKQLESPEGKNKIFRKLKEDFQVEEDTRRLAIRMTLIAEGDKVLTQLVMAWQQAKQTAAGGPQWIEVKKRLLELLDSTVQLTQS